MLFLGCFWRMKSDISLNEIHMFIHPPLAIMMQSKSKCVPQLLAIGTVRLRGPLYLRHSVCEAEPIFLLSMQNPSLICERYPFIAGFQVTGWPNPDSNCGLLLNN